MCFSCDYYNTTGHDMCPECGGEYAAATPAPVPAVVYAVGCDGCDANYLDNGGTMCPCCAFNPKLTPDERELVRVRFG